jgi:hypothetical protein
MHTGSHNIKNGAKYILHAVGPRWTDYTDKKACFRDLQNTFQNVLVYVLYKLPDVESLGVPLISSGVFGVPREMCIQALYDALCEFTARHEFEGSRFRRVLIVNFDAETNLDMIDYFKKKLATKPTQMSSLQKSDFKKEEEFAAKPKLNRDLEEVKNGKSTTKRHICELCDTPSENLRTPATCGCLYCRDCFNNVEQNNLKCVNEKCPY